jgi:hypothetical protein
MRIFDTTIYDKILVYPVNNEDKIVVEVPDEEFDDLLSVEVYNSIGQQIVENTRIKSNETILRPIRHSAGMYIVVILKGGGDDQSPMTKVRKEKIFLD